MQANAEYSADLWEGLMTIVTSEDMLQMLVLDHARTEVQVQKLSRELTSLESATLYATAVGYQSALSSFFAEPRRFEQESDHGPQSGYDVILLTENGIMRRAPITSDINLLEFRGRRIGWSRTTDAGRETLIAYSY